MKELEQKADTKIEVSVKQKKQVEHTFIGSIVPHQGHCIWEINNETLEIEKAKYSNVNYTLGAENKKEIIIKKGHTYIAALNKNNALKKFKQGNNGSKFKDNPISNISNLF